MKNQKSSSSLTLAAGIMATGLCAALISCSDSATGPNLASNNNSPGAGSGSLMIQADISFIENSGVVGGFSYTYAVNLDDGRYNPVSGATVTINGSTLAEALPANPGYYWINGTGAPSGDFRLDVVRGADNVRGVIVGGPGAHVILSPVAHDTLTAGDSLHVRWSTPVRAQNARVETRDTDPPFSTADDGSFWLPGVNNPARNRTILPAAVDQRLRLYRTNEVNVTGGITGSYFRVSVRQSVDPYVVQ